MARAASPTLIQSLWREERPAPALARGAVLALAGTLALWASARIQVPFWPVPMTMQTFVVLVLGMTYGARLGTVTVLLYLAEGALGLPVFAGTPERGIGLAYMMGPTGGFLLGFALATLVVGWLAQRGFDRTWGKALLALALGHVVLFVPGVLWLATTMGLDGAVAAAVTPFLAATVFKTLLAAACLPLAWRAVGRRDA